jgi:hypothetical protein
MRFVPIKDVEQQSAGMLLRTRPTRNHNRLTRLKFFSDRLSEARYTSSLVLVLVLGRGRCER